VSVLAGVRVCVWQQDIKPKNVFLTGKDCVRIGDLGCSKVMRQERLARTQIGRALLSRAIANATPTSAVGFRRIRSGVSRRLRAH
jgi:hypothetical protein